MNDAWQQLYRLWESGTPGALATVVSAYGSAPRPPGAINLTGERCLPGHWITASDVRDALIGAMKACCELDA